MITNSSGARKRKSQETLDIRALRKFPNHPLPHSVLKFQGSVFQPDAEHPFVGGLEVFLRHPIVPGEPIGVPAVAECINNTRNVIKNRQINGFAGAAKSYPRHWR